MNAILPFIIEAVIFCIPLVTLFITVGGYKKMVEDMAEKTKDLPAWRAETNAKVQQLELVTISQQNTLDSINKSLIEISTKVSLLLDNKLKLEGNE